MNDEPLAFFLTWTVYGTFLQGDSRGWHKRKRVFQPPQPRLAAWNAKRLKHSILLLGQEQRAAVDAEIQRLSNYRGWRLWASAVRTNHVHVVLAAPGSVGSKVRDQLKANATRVLRERWPEFDGRPVWSEGGDRQSVHDEDHLEQVILYVTQAQDRKGIEAHPGNSSAGGS